MKATFKSFSANNPSLFPEDIYEKIPQNHPARLVSEVVNGLNIDHIIKSYKGGGTSSFHPRMMIKVLFYSYFSNIYSCRKIERALQENIPLMWLAGNSVPDFRTINNFRGQRLKSHIDDLFKQIVLLLHDLNCISLKVQYIDGTKIESASGRYTFVWKGTVEKNKAKLEKKIQEVLAHIDSQIKNDDSELNAGAEPKPIDSALLKSKLEELNNKLKDGDKDTIKLKKKLEKEHLPRLEKYEQQLEILGERNSYSKTDVDATFMRSKDDHLQSGQLKAMYNPQISAENQYVTHFSVHQTTNDTTTLKPHLEGFEQQYDKQSEEIVADAGYGSEENFVMMESKSIEAYVKYNTFDKENKRATKNDPSVVDNLYYNEEKDFYVCPMGQKMECTRQGTRTTKNGYTTNIKYYQAQRCEGCPMRGVCHKSKEDREITVSETLRKHKEKARKLLESERGIYHRKKRPVEVEPVFGQVKSNNNFTRFTLRGLEKVHLEFGLMCIGHNLRKLSQNCQKGLVKSRFFVFYSVQSSMHCKVTTLNQCPKWAA